MEDDLLQMLLQATDATAVRRAPPPSQTRAGRMLLAGGIEGVAKLPTDVASLATLPITAIPRGYELQTVGRGQVVSRPRAQPPRLAAAVDKVLQRGTEMAESLGDVVGTPETPSEEDFRGIGSFAGNLAAWERLPFLLRNRQAFFDMYKLPPRDFIGGKFIPPGQSPPTVIQGRWFQP